MPFGIGLVARLAQRLPSRLRWEVFQEVLGGRDQWRVLAEVAGRCGVTSVIVDGEHGPIQGSPEDRAVLETYAKTRSWAGRTRRILDAFFWDHGDRGRYVDVGANIGLTTIPVAQHRDVQCLALEPEPRNYGHLEANVARNCPHGNVRLARVAVAGEHGRLSLELSSENFGDHYLRMPDQPSAYTSARPGIEVEVFTLDDLVPADDAPLAVKIDVQGAEPHVVQGGHRTLARAGLVILEWSPHSIDRMGSNPKIVTDFLRENFVSVRLAEGEDAEPSPAMTPGFAAQTLLTIMDERRADSSYYLDVIATADVARARR